MCNWGVAGATCGQGQSYLPSSALSSPPAAQGNRAACTHGLLTSTLPALALSWGWVGVVPAVAVEGAVAGAWMRSQGLWVWPGSRLAPGSPKHLSPGHRGCPCGMGSALVSKSLPLWHSAQQPCWKGKSSLSLGVNRCPLVGDNGEGVHPHQS